MMEEVKTTPQEQQAKQTQPAQEPQQAPSAPGIPLEALMQMQQQQQPLTYQQVKIIKKTALQMLHRQYTLFTQNILWLSGDEKSLDEGWSLIDAGFLSLQKAILMSPVALLPRINITPVPQPEAPTQQEKAQEVEKAPEGVKPEEKALASEPELTPAA